MWFIEDAITPAAILAAAGLFAVLSGWSAGRFSTAAIGLALLLLAAASFGVDALVVTERESLEIQLRQLCDDFRHKRAATLDHFGTPALKAMAAGAMALVTVEEDPRITDVRTEMKDRGKRATMHFRANATVSVQPYGNVGYQPSRFRLTWSKEPEGWKIVEVTRLHPVQDKELEILDATAG